MLLFMDGASYYDTTRIPNKWTTLNSTACTWAQAAEGRTDGCLRRTSTSNNASPGFIGFTPLRTQAGTWTASRYGRRGLAIKVDDLSTLSINDPTPFSTTAVSNYLFSLTNGSFWPFAVGLGTNGTLSVRRNGFSTKSITLGTSLQAVTTGQWAYLEAEWYLSYDADGVIILRSNNTVVFSFTGRTCPNAADMTPFAICPLPWNSAEGLRLVAPTATASVIRICDTYISDEASPNGSLLGDISVRYIVSDGIGAASAWTPSAGNNWECVDEVPPNDDTDYVETLAVGTRDTYEFQDVVPGDPIAIQASLYLKKLTSDAASVSVITRQGGADYDSPAQGIASTAYGMILQPYDTNPATGIRWTESEMNAGQWGTLKAA